MPRNTQAAYESAKQECERLKIYAIDLGQAHPDAAYAYRQGLERLCEASDRYSRSLILMNRFGVRDIEMGIKPRGGIPDSSRIYR
jgi:hypothetical protein